MQANAIDRWWKYKVTKIHTKARFKDLIYPCNFKVLNENECKIYFRIPHTKKVIFSLVLPTKDLEFHKNTLFKRAGDSKVRVKRWGTIIAKKTVLSVNYEVKINNFSEKNLKELKEHLSANVKSKIVRRRGTAIVDISKGILVAAHHNTWLLPGGGANRGESREKAAIRELREETGLKAISCKYLFEYDEPNDGRRIRNLHKVFLIEAEGSPKPNNRDVHHLAFWNPSNANDIRLSPTTMKIVSIYLTKFKK